MLKENMYVRCPIDEDYNNPRNFIMGQIKEINDFDETLVIHFQDPFGFRSIYDEIPKKAVLPIYAVDRCTFYKGSYVKYNNKKYLVLESEKIEEWYHYYLQDSINRNVLKVREDLINSPFYNGRVIPSRQLLRYEFQNPCWYLGRNIVSKTMHILENSIYGFKELAGSKIFLLPHQIKTIMRCLQSEPTRFMLADEVGMGKTIEAISVLKIYLSEKSHKRILVLVPKSLIAQWETELFFKFGLSKEEDLFHNRIYIKATEDMEKNIIKEQWDFVVIDEVHNLIHSSRYQDYYKLSENTENILLLSATPVQQKEEEYLKLLKLLMPNKYINYNVQKFKKLVEKQRKITKTSYIILMDLEDYEKEVYDLLSINGNPKESEDCIELFDELVINLKKIESHISDDVLTSMIGTLYFEEPDFGINKIQEVMFYVSDNYQIERNIIRNRRSIINESLPKRSLSKIGYALDPNRNTFEFATYSILMKWIESQGVNENDFKDHYIPLINAFFSSPWAFLHQIKIFENRGKTISNEICSNAESWRRYEEEIMKHLAKAIDDPELYHSRLIKVIDYLSEEAYDKKVVLFTNYEKTFNAYKKGFLNCFEESEVAFFKKGDNSEDLELNVYRFQNESTCRILLCDESGGEGRNFQSADEVLHIDLPWNANIIEQRIGRLDRIGRDPVKDIKSVVVYTQDTLEEEMLSYWDKGLKIFDQSLSGLEIIMNDINASITKAITHNYKYGLSESIDDIIKTTQEMEEEIREEQRFDTASYMYASMNLKLDKLIREYSSNENNLFANTMLSWSSLAGLKGTSSDKNYIAFSERSFSVNSARNSMLIPPNWKDYMDKKSNKFISKIHDNYNQKYKPRNVTIRTINGTFDRKTAIENDYLHFFSPGDEVFDSIVDNAIRSSKGQVTAFAAKSDIDWKGLVFTWTIEPNEKILLDNNVSLMSLSPFRNYLAIDQLTIPVSSSGDNGTSIDKVNEEIEKLFKTPFFNQTNNISHLGKRSKNGDFIGIRDRYNISNIEWFKNKYTEEKWESFVNMGHNYSREEAFKEFKKRSDLREAKNEMSRMLNAIKASERYYGLKTTGYAEMKRQNEIVLEALKNPKITLDSACFLWLVKVER